MALICKTSLSDIQQGDYVWVKYQSTSNAFGTFSDIATKTDEDVVGLTVPVSSSIAPNGYVKLICVGYDFLGRRKLISNVNIQHSISWDVINSAGVVNGRDLNIDGITNFNFTVRLLTGGVSSTDIFNEWDKIIAESTLGGAITASDNNVWNAVGITSWTSSTGTTSANRIVRGGTTVSTTNAPTGLVSTTVNVTTGFRPMLLVEDLTVPYSNKFLVKTSDKILTLLDGVWTDTLLIVDDLTEENVMEQGFENIKNVTSNIWALLYADFTMPFEIIAIASTTPTLQQTNNEREYGVIGQVYEKEIDENDLERVKGLEVN